MMKLTVKYSTGVTLVLYKFLYGISGSCEGSYSPDHLLGIAACQNLKITNVSKP
jgi:hypothetical protein